MTRVHTPLACLALATLLAACGGGGDDATATAGGGGKLTLSASGPSAHNGDIDMATAQNKGNEARAADAAIATAYCALTFERNKHGSNANLYYVTVYFRQSDAKVLQAAVFAPGNGWSVNHFNASAGIDGVVVDRAARSVSFTNKVLTAGAGTPETTTVNGSFSFDRHASVAACGA